MTDQPTNRPTDHSTPSVAQRPHLRSTVMQAKMGIIIRSVEKKQNIQNNVDSTVQQQSINNT